MNDNNKTIEEKIENGYYTTASIMPRKPKLVCPNTECATKFSTDQKFCAHCGTDLQEYSKGVLDIYNKEVSTFRKEETAKLTEFKKDVITHFKLTRNPKKDNIFSFAMEQCQDKGFQCVIDMLEAMQGKELF